MPENQAVHSRHREAKAAVSLPSLLVVACCSAKKARPADIRARSLVEGAGSDFADRWLGAVAAPFARSRAGELYQGRAFRTLRAAARQHQTSFAILSAGLGFVAAETEIPSYSMTVAAGEDGLATLAPSLTPSAWWTKASASPFSQDPVSAILRHDVTLVALTQPYARMIGDDLERLASETGRLRLFGLGLETIVPAAVRGALLPYDRRAEAFIAGGVQGEFGARALAFHLARWKGQTWNLATEVEDARRLCASEAAPAPSTRRRAGDAEIQGLIQPLRSDNRPPLSLRDLRALGIACGSDRYSRLVAAEGERA